MSARVEVVSIAFPPHLPIVPAATIKREIGVSKRLSDTGGGAAGEVLTATSGDTVKEAEGPVVLLALSPIACFAS